MSGIHGPGAALDFHVRLFADTDRVDRWISENEGRRVATASIPQTFLQRSLLVTASSKMVLTDGGHTLRPDRPDQAGSAENVGTTARLIRNERTVLNEGATWYVSQHIAATVASFADVAEPEPLFVTDVPADTGLIVLETPLLLNDLHPDTGEQVIGLHMPITAIGWQRAPVARPTADGELNAAPGITYFLYTRTDQWVEHYIPAMRRLLGEDEADIDALIASRSEWCFMSDYSGWAFGASWQVSESVQDSRPGYVPDSVSFIRRWLLALFRFTWQQILVGHTHHPSRAERRRFDRVKSHIPKDGYIKVVRLRREVEAERRGERPSPGETMRNHQWIVRGHPRRQWYPKLGPARHEDGSFNHDSHRLIWIEAHAAGNPFGELVRGHEVVAVVR